MKKLILSTFVLLGLLLTAFVLYVWNQERTSLKWEDVQAYNADKIPVEPKDFRNDFEEMFNVIKDKYAYKDTSPSASGSSGHIKKYSWVLGTLFSTGLVDSSYDVTFNADNAPVTALAANKDGLFAGVKESYQDVGTVWQYRLKIKKYKKSNGVADGELILVNQAPVDTDLSGKPIDNTFTDHIRIQYGESINALQVFDGVLYALSSKSRKTQKQNGIPYYTDAFKSSGKLYKIGNTNDTLSGNAVVLAKYLL